MARYRKKPVVIEAEQWFHGRQVEGMRTHDGCRNPMCELCGGSGKPKAWVSTLEGPLTVSPGDFIITGVKGERYPCKPDIFAATFEAVE
ncbi:MAG: PGDYG domain-containing protein [Myxococcaceae bacterium]|nr:PGDYG domain-containing protein [Myxococcaceae bacterium]